MRTITESDYHDVLLLPRLFQHFSGHKLRFIVKFLCLFMRYLYYNGYKKSRVEKEVEM